MKTDEKIVFSRTKAKRKKNKFGFLKTNASQPFTNPCDALKMLNKFSGGMPRIFIKENGQYKPIYGFSFDVSDIQKVVNNLTDDKHELYVGFGINDKDDHTVIVGAVNLTRDVSGVVTDREFLVETNRAIYDYCNPCPPNNPISITGIICP